MPSSTHRKQLVIFGSIVVLAVVGSILIDEEEDVLFLPGTTCDDSPPCPDGRKCEMVDPICYSRICDSEQAPACVFSVFGPRQVTEEDEYIRLPGRSCDDAPPCPDGRSCIMEEKKCYSRLCDSETVPVCAYNSKY